MAMSALAQQQDRAGQEGTPLSPLDPRSISPVPPPPMVVTYKGWWNDHTTLRQVADLEREDGEACCRA